jgi:beta-lactamase regulating signal transducer with metallopeptidase domain
MIGWAVETLVAATLLMLLVLVLRGPVARRFGPQAAYALWALPALRMILPPIPDHWRPVEFAPIGAATTPGVVMLGVPVAEVPALPQGWGMADVPLAVIALWLLGAIGFVAWHVVSHRRFCARVLASGRARGVAGGHVRVIETRHAAGPLAFGVLRRYVAMPADFGERYDDREQALALAHELAHHARGDLLANWVALMVLGCHWFNPVAWRAFRAFRADQEMACDAMVLARATAGVRHAYATAIVKSAQGRAVSAACHLHSIHELKGRLVMLSKHRAMSPAARRIAGTGTLALAVLGLGITASGTQAAEAIRGKVERATGVEIARVETRAAAALAPVTALTPMAGITPAQAAPMPAPAIPATVAAPAAVPVPVAVASPVAPKASAKVGEVRTIVVRQLDGDNRVVSESTTTIPQVIDGNCGTVNGAYPTSTGRTVNGRTATIVCKDNIQRIVVRAEADAVRGAKAAASAQGMAASSMRSALAGMRAARASVATQAGLTADARAEAIAGIDEGIRELQSEIESRD